MGYVLRPWLLDWPSKDKSVTIEGETAKYLRVNNLALEGRPQDLAFTTHVCRGNYNSTLGC